MRLIRYRPKDDKADANQQHIEAVFRELQAEAPEGIRYLVVRLEDGSFVHLVEGADTSGLTALPAFRAFQSGFAERAPEPPLVNTATVIGNYRMIGG